MKVALGRVARDDLHRLLDYLDERSPAAARKAATQIRQGLSDIGLFPQAGRPIGDHFRETPIRFGRDGFIVRYRVTDRVEIVRLFHGREDRRLDDA